MLTYKYCTNCTTKLDKSGEYPHCVKCGITYYKNSKPCASVLPVKNGKVLLSKRAVAPNKGEIDIIGGFLEEDELPEKGALREAKEETGLDMKIIGFLGHYVDRYGEKGDWTLSVNYVTKITGGKMKAQEDISSLHWLKIGEIPKKVTFKNVKDTLKDLGKWYRNNKNNE